MARKSAKRNPALEGMLDGSPELDLFPTPEARTQAINEYNGGARGWGLLVGILACLAAAAAGFLGAGLVSQGLRRLGLYPAFLPARLVIIPQLLCALLAHVYMLRYLHRHGAARAMRPTLRALGVPVCLECGYLLRGLDPSNTNACPECGRELDVPTRALIASDRLSDGQPS